MAESSRLDLSRLTGIYLVANTPLYLFRRFRQDDSIRRFAAANTTEELLNVFLSHARKSKLGAEDVVTAYAALIALSHKGALEIHDAIQRFAAPGIQWLSDLRELVVANSITTNATGFAQPLPQAGPSAGAQAQPLQGMPTKANVKPEAIIL